MRVLHVNIGYPPFIGGAQVFLQQVARRAARRGDEVLVCASDAGEIEYLWRRDKKHLPVGAEDDEGVAVRRFAVRHLPLLPYSYHALRRGVIELNRSPLIGVNMLWRWSRYTPWLPDLGAFFRKPSFQADLIHAWNIPFESLLGPAQRCAQQWDIPFVCTPLVHLGDLGDEGVRRFYTMRHQMALLRQSDAVIALTDIEADFLIAQGIDRRRLHVIGGGVDAETLQRGDASRFRERYALAAPFVLYIGALNYQKGATHLAQAMQQLWQQGNAAELVMIGQPMDHFLRFYEQLPTLHRARCHLLGAASERDKADALTACELLAMPSRTESFGLVYLEAWACGKPVIGARAGATQAVIQEGVDGLLVRFGDIEGLARAVAALLADPQRARALGRAGQAKTLDRCTWDAVEAQIAEVYQAVLAERGKQCRKS